MAYTGYGATLTIDRHPDTATAALRAIREAVQVASTWEGPRPEENVLRDLAGLLNIVDGLARDALAQCQAEQRVVERLRDEYVIACHKRICSDHEQYAELVMERVEQMLDESYLFQFRTDAHPRGCATAELTVYVEGPKLSCVETPITGTAMQDEDLVPPLPDDPFTRYARKVEG